MKVLQSCLSLSWGGMEMYTVTTANQLKKRNFDVTLLCAPGSKIYEAAAKYGIKTITSKAKNYFHPLEIVKMANHLKNEGLTLFILILPKIYG